MRSRWTVVCPYSRLEPERGVAALVDGVQVALFRLHDGRVYAIGNQDPLTGAYVLSRGLVGTRGDAPTVASPLHKQVYDLRTGACLDRPAGPVPAFPVRCRDGLVEVRADPLVSSASSPVPVPVPETSWDGLVVDRG